MIKWILIGSCVSAFFFVWALCRAASGPTPSLPPDDYKAPEPDCSFCHGSGSSDSGGQTPWGEWIAIRCGCTYKPRPSNLIVLQAR